MDLSTIISLLLLIVSLIILLLNAPKLLNNFIDGIHSLKERRLMYKKVIYDSDLSDEESVYLHKIKEPFSFEETHRPKTDDDKAICEDLANYGALIRNNDGSYRVSRAGKNILYGDEDSESP